MRRRRRSDGGGGLFSGVDSTKSLLCVACLGVSTVSMVLYLGVRLAGGGTTPPPPALAASRQTDAQQASDWRALERRVEGQLNTLAAHGADAGGSRPEDGADGVCAECASRLWECHNAAVATTDAVESTLSLKRRETELLANQLEDAKAAATAAHAEAESLREQLRAAAGTADAPCPACPDVAAAPPAAVAPAPTASKKWLVIGMPSMPRENADYLNPTLDYILEQLPEDPLHPYFGRVLIVVMSNARGAPHPAFDTAKARLDPSQHPKGSFVHFVENGPQPDPLGDVKDAGSNDKPGYKVRQQTRDVAALLEYAGEMGKLYMFMEDDFRLCPLALRSLQYLVEKVDRLYPNWVMIRTGFGLNGGLIHASDTQFLAAYYREHQARRPPDHMLVEWFAGERPQSKEYVKDRKHIAYRYNLFEHIGFHSSLRSTKAERFAACYEELKYPTLFEVEAFKPECKHEDIWPCPSAVDEDHPMIDMVSVHRAVRRHGEHV